MSKNNKRCSSSDRQPSKNSFASSLTRGDQWSGWFNLAKSKRINRLKKRELQRGGK